MQDSPHSAPQGASITRAQLDAALARRALRLRFAPALESWFEHDTGPQRCRHLFNMGLFGIAMLVLLLVPLRLLLRDILPLVLVVQLGVNLPVSVAMLCLLRMAPRPLWRELYVVIGTMTSVASICWLTLHSSSPYRWAVPHMYTLAFLYITAMQRLRFLPAAVSCALMALCNLFLMSRLPLYEEPALVASTLVLLGAVVFALTGTYFSERQERQRYLFAQLARLQNAELERLSRYDPLTGLGNRRALNEQLTSAGALRTSGQLSAILLDIDHFKQLNDAAGHQAGDRCLARIAGIMQAELRDQRDHAFRYGGEEFVLLLQNTSERVALNVAERLRYAIEAAGIRNPGLGPQGQMTVSLGVASAATGPDFNGERLVALADRALYSAKEAGRNCVYRTSVRSDGTVVTAAAA